MDGGEIAEWDKTDSKISPLCKINPQLHMDIGQIFVEKVSNFPGGGTKDCNKIGKKDK